MFVSETPAMTPSDLEAVKRAVALITKPIGNEGLSNQDWIDVHTALSVLRPIAEGKSVVVPKEPTSRQHEAGKEAYDWHENATERKIVQRYSLWDTIYRAMLTPAQGEGK